MKNLYIELTRDVKVPSRAHDTDAGIDFYIPNDMEWETYTIWSGKSLLIDSGIRADVPKGFALICLEKSGIATKFGLLIGAKVVDAGYQGNIHIHLVNPTNANVTVERGMKIAQFVCVPIVTPRVVLTENLFGGQQSERGESGFGSTGIYEWQKPEKR